MKNNTTNLVSGALVAVLAVGLAMQTRTTAQPPPGGTGPGGPGAAQGPPGGPGGFGPGGPGGRGGGGMRRGFGAPPRPGQILPEMLQNRLKLTDTQKVQLAKLQKDVDTKLAKILTADQNRQLEAMKTRGPGGFGGPGRGQGRPGAGGPPGPSGASAQ